MLKRFFINKNDYTRKIILGLSDTHGMLEQGLQNPETQFSDGDGYELRPLNATQTDLWFKVFEPGVKNVSELAGDDEIVCLHGGDVAHGNKYPEGLTSNKVHDQFTVARWNLKPILDLPQVKKIYIASGTPAHSFGSNAAEAEVAMTFQAVHPDKIVRAISQKELSINGYVVELFHHGPSPGRRKHTKGNVARGFLLDRMIDSFEEGEKPPDLFLCGHFHEFVEDVMWKRNNGIDYRSRIIIMPPLCTFGDWGRQTMKSLKKVEVGIVAIETVNGKYLETHKFTQTLRLTGKEMVC